MRLPRKRWWLPPVAGLAAAGLAWFALPWAVDLPPGMGDPPRSPLLLDRHGEVMHRLTLSDFTRSSPVTYDEIPQELIDCVLAAEDKRFFRHGGVDLLATGRAAFDWVRYRQAVSGASTLTQQLVKISSPPRSRTLTTKLHESLVARRLEMSWSKREILAAYLNRLDLGNRRVGVREAARFYFQKPLSHLSLGECALLAGLPQAPSRYDPLDAPDKALKRREIVLERLARTGNYDARRISDARTEPLRLRPLDEERIAPWLPAQVDGDVRTTLDAGLQRQVERIVAEEVAELRSRNLRHVAVVVIDNASGDILALVSSGDWDDPRGGQINGALARRSPGSTLKPFTYLLAFRSGRYPGSIIADVPTRFRTREGLDAPENYDRGYRGPVTIRQALACSLNVPAMRELNRLGGPEPLAELLGKLGIAVAADGENGLGLTIGNAPVRLLDLTNAYATLARGGRHRPARLDPQHASPVSRIFGETEAWLIADILADPRARAPAFGLGGPLQLPFPCAAKTGTSSNFRDNWCVGFTRDFTVGVWAGNFDNTPMRGLSGIAGAGPVFQRTMLALHESRDPAWFERPTELVAVRIDPRNGLQVGEGARHSVMEWVRQGHEPAPAKAEDYDEAGRWRLGSAYAEWLRSDNNRRRSEFAAEVGRASETPLRILAPRPGATYVLDPELPNGGFLHLASNQPGRVEWQCDSLELRPGPTEPVAILRAGRHRLVATDSRTGQTEQIEIEVKAW